MSFMDDIIRDSLDLWKAAADEPFLEELGKGTLDKKMFYDYIVQDSIYLRYYLKDNGMTDDDVETIERLPACVNYTDFLIKSAESDDLPGILMAVMPCMLGYEYVFKETLKRHPEVMDTYYGPLVSDYTNKWYDECCRIWTEYCNNKCECVSVERKKQLSDIFREASLHELKFWQMAGGR